MLRALPADWIDLLLKYVASLVDEHALTTRVRICFVRSPRMGALSLP
jgi:hypothetical protein